MPSPSSMILQGAPGDRLLLPPGGTLKLNFRPVTAHIFFFFPRFAPYHAFTKPPQRALKPPGPASYFFSQLPDISIFPPELFFSWRLPIFSLPQLISPTECELNGPVLTAPYRQNWIPASLCSFFTVGGRLLPFRLEGAGSAFFHPDFSMVLSPVPHGCSIARGRASSVFQPFSRTTAHLVIFPRDTLHPGAVQRYE